FATLNSLLLEVQELPLVVGGDFNQIIDPVLDRSKPGGGGRSHLDREALKSLMLEHGLSDIWRLLHPQALEFTFRSGSHGTRTRIDMFLTSRALVNSVHSCDIGVRALLDHVPLDLVLDWVTGLKRRGRWKLNGSLLHSEQHQQEIRQVLQDFLDTNLGSVDSHGTLWEAGKATMRGRFIAMSSRLRREGNRRAMSLERHISELELRFDDSPQGDTLQNLMEAKFELNTIYHKRAEDALFHLKHTQYKSGDRAGKFLAAMVRQRELGRMVSGIRAPSGSLVTDPKQIAGAFLKYYETLYTSEGRDFLEDVTMPCISQTQRDRLDAPITEHKIWAAIQGMRAVEIP
uniref:Endonuclease/exonuclease/phosphatase domain-containing protein n=1 Tax=Latimeria chalumnae TaxID=7897 RepID=H3B6A0_LATCH